MTAMLMPEWAEKFRREIEEVVSHQEDDEVLLVERKEVGVRVAAAKYAKIFGPWQQELVDNGHWPKIGAAYVIVFFDRPAKSVNYVTFTPTAATGEN